MRLKLQITTLIATAAILVSVANLKSQDAKTNPPAAAKMDQSEPAKKESTDKKVKPAPKKLTGAELYSIHCNRCHPERYPTERTAAQWKTILLHMRVRANIPAGQARMILKYLQENSGR
ncbi:MAG TPA: hypothetical protein VH598_04465 [Verrucomicrobiae bacterium]|nr:hypothetical protein [Verrucomicrobiae bacterium]